MQPADEINQGARQADQPTPQVATTRDPLTWGWGYVFFMTLMLMIVVGIIRIESSRRILSHVDERIAPKDVLGILQEVFQFARQKYFVRGKKNVRQRRILVIVSRWSQAHQPPYSLSGNRTR